jgi:hypothetical protein
LSPVKRVILGKNGPSYYRKSVVLENPSCFVDVGFQHMIIELALYNGFDALSCKVLKWDDLNWVYSM